jgi:hypothetical protein
MGAFDDVPFVDANKSRGTFDDVPMVRAPVRRSDGAAQSFGQGVTFGAGDELTAAVRAAFPQFSNWMMSGPALKRDESIGGPPAAKLSDLITGNMPGATQTVSTAPTYQGRYDEELSKERQKLKDFGAQNPVLAIGSEIAGNVAGGIALTALPGVGTLFTGSAGLPASIAKGVAGGALLGGAQGFASGEGGYDNRLGSATTGAIVGGALGGALPVVGRGASVLYEKAAPKVLNTVANVADRFSPRVVPKSLSAAAPEGGSVTGDSWATRLADTARTAAGNVEEDAAIKRLARTVAGDRGVAGARRELDRLGEDAMLLDTGTGAQRLANVGYMTSDDAANTYRNSLSTRNARTGERFINAMGDDANVPSAYDAQRFLTQYRSAKGSEIYDPVLRGDNPLNISPEMQAILDRPGSSTREAMDRILAQAEKDGIDLTAGEALHRVKRTLNADAEQSVLGGGKSIQKDFVKRAADRFEGELYAANPDIRAADRQYSEIASLYDPKTGDGWLKRGQNFLRSGQDDVGVQASNAALHAELPRATPNQLSVLRAGAADNMRGTALDGARSTRRLANTLVESTDKQSKLARIFGQDQASNILSRSQAELEFAANQNRVLGGSPTAERSVALAREVGLSDLPRAGGDILGILGKVKDFMAKTDAASEPVRARIAVLLSDPNAATNAQTLALVEEMIARQARARLSAGAPGAGASLSGDR